STRLPDCTFVAPDDRPAARLDAAAGGGIGLLGITACASTPHAGRADRRSAACGDRVRRGAASDSRCGPAEPHPASITTTSPSIASVGDAKSGPRFSLIQGSKVWVEVSATDLLVNSDTAMTESSGAAIR